MTNMILLARYRALLANDPNIDLTTKASIELYISALLSNPETGIFYSNGVIATEAQGTLTGRGAGYFTSSKRVVLSSNAHLVSQHVLKAGSPHIDTYSYKSKAQSSATGANLSKSTVDMNGNADILAQDFLPKGTAESLAYGTKGDILAQEFLPKGVAEHSVLGTKGTIFGQQILNADTIEINSESDATVLNPVTNAGVGKSNIQTDAKGSIIGQAPMPRVEDVIEIDGGAQITGSEPNDIHSTSESTIDGSAVSTVIPTSAVKSESDILLVSNATVDNNTVSDILLGFSDIDMLSSSGMLYSMTAAAKVASAFMNMCSKAILSVDEATAADWEYPVYSNGNLSITQVYGATQTNTNLEVM